MTKNIEEVASWEDVNKCLKEIGECEIAVESLEVDLQMRINDAKAEAERLGKPLKKIIASLKEQISDFVEDKKQEMPGKTKELTFGKVGYRQTSSISLPTKKMEKILQNLRKFGMEDCIDVKESVNKELLKRYSDSEIVKIGASRKTEDKFWCEADREKIRG